ncbi:C1-like protein, partial [Tanacetum coccineum]
MEEINHFGHEKHPLKLIDWETIIGIIGVDCCDDERKSGGGAVGCDICEEPLSNGDSAYACIQCRFFIHKLCSQFPYTINLPSLYQHPLEIIFLKNKVFGLTICHVCDRKITRGFCYAIHMLDKGKFRLCGNCFRVEFARKTEADAIKKEAMVKLDHKCHPQHTLTLQLRPASFNCDACRTEEKGLFYQCDSCDFWIHKSCASLPPTLDLPHHHHKHTLVLVYSLPENFYRFRYFFHIKCALNAQQQSSTSRDDPRTSAAIEDVISLLHFPMSEAFTNPLKLLHSENLAQDDDETAEIYHWSHPDHPLILNVEDPQGNNMMPDINSGEPIEVCYACVQPLSFPYYNCKEDGCSIFTDLHKYCAHLPQKLQHQLHPDHTLDLVDAWEDEMFYNCNGCTSWGNTFAYKCGTKCKFYLCVNCAFLPKTIKHESHNHPLTQLIDPEVICKACNTLYSGISYSCKACDFGLGIYCAMRSPLSIAHRYCKGHEIPLTYPPVENHPEDFYCDSCEEEMDPILPLYHCQECKYRNSFHLGCISRTDWYANIWYGGNETVSYHKHPLTYVRRKKTPKYVCSACNQDINDYLVLECRAKTQERKEVINHFGHEKHPLKLIDWEMIRGKGDDEEENSKGAVVECDMCEEPLSIGDSAIDKGFAYLSFSNAPTGFNCCSNCFFVEFACKAEDDSLKEEASIKFQHEGHPQHTLTLQSRPATFRCDACKTEEKGLYFAHIKCALNAPSPSTPRDCPSTSGANEDSNSLLHFPMSDVFTDPLKLLHLDNLSLDDIDKLEIKHQSHRHPLTLNVEPQHNNMPSTSDSIEACDFVLGIYCAMRSPISLAH